MKAVKYSVRKFLSVALLTLAPTGCMSFRPIEPVINAPASFRGDATVPVEFVNPALVGLRCAERGVKFLGLPGVNAGACGDAQLITMPNPCMTLTGGWYASTLCHELAHVNGWSPDHRGGTWLAKSDAGAGLPSASEGFIPPRLPRALSKAPGTILAAADAPQSEVAEMPGAVAQEQASSVDAAQQIELAVLSGEEWDIRLDAPEPIADVALVPIEWAGEADLPSVSDLANVDVPGFVVANYAAQ